ncbi:MAG: multiheme c-type cytochrome [Pikeienuella sp.]|uniref:multiheme c-type cytochrome n=1 Tax=Pikeienuella sp. TaxID=2831957 RepID=UPI00391DAEC8
MSRLSATAILFLALAWLAPPAVAQDVHLGVKSCGSSGCHGQVASSSTNVLLNEYVTWQKYDAHATAYKVLLEPRSQRIAANLGLPNAHEAKICLDCHADNVPEEKRGPQFVLADGVGCEACHGAGSAPWMGLHIGGSPHDQNVQNGLIPLEDPIVRAGICLDCHLGDEDQFATHRIMGAGHPRISFEMDSFTDFQPAHFLVDDDYRKRKRVVDGVRTWAIGQALMVERRMDLLADSKFATDGLFPELAFFDCHACHQPMSSSLPTDGGEFPTAWNPRPGTGLGPGVAKFNDSNMLMLEIALDMAAPDLADRMAQHILDIHKASQTSREAMNAAARATKETARQAVEILATKEIDAAAMRKAMETLIEKGSQGYFADYETAEQATMAIGAIIEAMRVAGFVDTAGYDKLSASMEPVYAAVANDERYVVSRFIGAVQGLAASL